MELKVSMLNPEEIHPYFRNSKLHSKKQITDIARSIREFGFDQPIVVDQNKIIIKGHGRYYASLRLKLKVVPVVIREDLTPAQVLAARISDNKVFEMTQIDQEVRAEELAALAEDTGTLPDFDFLPKPKKQGKGAGPSATPATVDQEAFDIPDGKLEVCPKCTKTFFVQ